MRNSSFLLLLMTLASAAPGGEQLKPPLPHEAMILQAGCIRPEGRSARLEHLREWMGGASHPAGATSNPEVLAMQSIAPGSATRQGTSVLSGSMNALSEAPLPPDAPFDTALAIAEGPRERHIFTHDAHDNLTNWLIQLRDFGGWYDARQTSFSYTPSGLIAGRVLETFHAHGYNEAYALTYDGEGRILSRRYESRSGDRLLSWDDYEVRYDSDGSPRSEAWRRWSEPSAFDGQKWDNILTDSTQVSVSARWTSDGWIDQKRVTWGWDPRFASSVERCESWTGDAWVNTSLTIYETGVNDNEYYWYQALTYSWTNSAWACSLKTEHTSRVDGRGSETVISALHEGAWIPQTRWLLNESSDPPGSSWAQQIWENGWVNAYHSIQILRGDGGTVSIDSAWEAGRVTYVSIGSSLAGGKEMYRESFTASEGVIDQGWRYARTIGPANEDLVIEESLWAGGTWTPERRHVFSYDIKGRPASVVHDVWMGTAWIRASFSPYGWPSLWHCGTNTISMIEIAGFNELYFTYHPSATGINERPEVVPQETALRQNYPNPFNPTTTIPFAVSTGSRTTIAIYDVLGREVARPVDEWKDPGEYNVEFDAKGLASGMYLSRFTSGSVCMTTKLLLTR